MRAALATNRIPQRRSRRVARPRCTPAHARATAARPGVYRARHGAGRWGSHRSGSGISRACILCPTPAVPEPRSVRHSVCAVEGTARARADTPEHTDLNHRQNTRSQRDLQLLSPPSPGGGYRAAQHSQQRRAAAAHDRQQRSAAQWLSSAAWRDQARHSSLRGP